MSLTVESNCQLQQYNQILNTISTLPALKRFHAFIVVKGLSHHLSIATKLIFVATSVSRKIDYARKLFDVSPQRDSFMWNTLLRGYADLGPCEEVPVIYREMHRSGFLPDSFTFTFVVRACAVVSALVEGKQAHCNVVKHGLNSNVFMKSALVTMYAQNGEVLDSELVFGEMTCRNIVSWTSMVAAYVQNCCFAKALDVFRSMCSCGVLPNEVTLVGVLPALRGPECLFSGMSAHGYAIKMGFESHVSLVNALMAMYGKCGSVDVAKALFEEMPVRSLVSWNTMIAMYEQSRDANRAIKLFRRMLTEKVGFNSITLVSVISACSSSGAIETGKWLHDLARKRGLDNDVRVANALLDMYGRCGCIDIAQEIFDKIALRGIVSWSALIRAYAVHGCARKALELFSQMRQEGIKPNTFTYTSVLHACSHSGLVDEGLKHFDIMKDYDVIPTLEHCACIVDLLGRAGRLDDAYQLIKNMVLVPDTGVWGAFLGACRIHENFTFADSIAEELFELGSDNVTFFILMANIYAEAGKWGDASRMRNMMKELELKKTPGSSLVNIDKKCNDILFVRQKLRSL